MTTPRNGKEVFPDGIINPGAIIVTPDTRKTLTDLIIEKLFNAEVLDSYPMGTTVNTRYAAINALNEADLPTPYLLGTFGGFPFKDADSLSVEALVNGTYLEELYIRLYKTPDKSKKGKHIIFQDYVISTGDEYDSYEVRRVNPEHYANGVGIETSLDDVCNLVNADDVAGMLHCAAPRLDDDVYHGTLDAEASNARIIGSILGLKESATTFVEEKEFSYSASQDDIFEDVDPLTEGVSSVTKVTQKKVDGKKTTETEQYAVRRRIPEVIEAPDGSDVYVWLDFLFAITLDKHGKRHTTVAHVDVALQDHDSEIDKTLRRETQLNLSRQLSNGDFELIIKDAINEVFDPQRIH